MSWSSFLFGKSKSTSEPVVRPASPAYVNRITAIMQKYDFVPPSSGEPHYSVYVKLADLLEFLDDKIEKMKSE